MSDPQNTPLLGASRQKKLTLARLWPHTEYAEDQKFAGPILFSHVLARGFTMGSIFGLAGPPVMYGMRALKIVGPAKTAVPLARQFLRSSGTGAIVVTGLMALAVPLRMRGREEIEWQDRGWRLLENKGQTEVDDWTCAGIALGAIGVAVRSQGLGVTGAIGGMGVGSIIGLAGYMGWRYGIKGGKFE